VWFSNRRAKWRREEKLRNQKRPPGMDTTMAPANSNVSANSAAGSSGSTQGSLLNPGSTGTPLGSSPTATPARFNNPVISSSFAPPSTQMYPLPQPAMDPYSFANAGLGMGTSQHPSDFSSYHMFSSAGRSPYDAFHPYARTVQPGAPPTFASTMNHSSISNVGDETAKIPSKSKYERYSCGTLLHFSASLTIFIISNLVKKRGNGSNCRLVSYKSSFMVMAVVFRSLGAGMSLPVSVLSTIDQTIPSQQPPRFDDLTDAHHDPQYWRTNFSS
ncbi:unnamed protein product, partial [Cercopithifilaria johnstoni]